MYQETQKQTRFESLLEALIGVLIGFVINWTANIYVLGAFGYDVSPRTAFFIGIVFTFISVVRSYVIRRWAQQHLSNLVRKAAADKVMTALIFGNVIFFGTGIYMLYLSVRGILI